MRHACPLAAPHTETAAKQHLVLQEYHWVEGRRETKTWQTSEVTSRGSRRRRPSQPPQGSSPKPRVAARHD
ncbi:hypothetical protein CCUS01_07675 [Colletotrichum cuscutae]|uniref:Uncharacterized protein n=1 Tax=Colletotrichum cuscutae TaxID=1209917 RepID=A0AAI9UV29_9PEZI|nr:hypothetical protein CCUS01_07675 [Colletotrichum cuscutae]